MNLDSIKLPQEWKELLKDDLQSQYFEDITKAYRAQLQSGKILYPPPRLLFHAFNATLPQDVRVVILGQDPYHGRVAVRNGDTIVQIPQAMGLSFSVPMPLPPPPSLKNIYAELARTMDFVPPTHGDLSAWAKRGVLLLNSILSVQANNPTSHKNLGWQQFSDAVIAKLSAQYTGIVFLLWGNYAKAKATLIDSTKHCVITAPHPSPLAKGFVGSDCFVKADAYLKAQGKSIDWSL